MSRKRITKQGSPGPRVEVANALLSAAKTIDHPAIAPKLAALAEVNQKYVALHARVGSAERSLSEQRGVATEAAQEVNAATQKLSGFLITDGFSYRNPLDAFDCDSPANLRKLGRESLADKTERLSKMVQARDGVSPATVEAARKLGDAAEKLRQSLAALKPLEAQHTSAIFERDALEAPWEAQYRALELATQVAEAEGAQGLHERLFGAVKSRRARRSPGTPTPPHGAPPSSSAPAPVPAHAAETAHAPTQAEAPAVTPQPSSTHP